MSTEVEQAAAIRALLAAPLGTPASDPGRGVFDYDDAPATLPKLYARVTVSKRAGAPVYMSGGKAMRGYRLTTLAVGTTVDEARWVRDKIAATIEDRPVVIAGRETTRLRMETEQPIEPDDGRYSGLTTWTYAL